MTLQPITEYRPAVPDHEAWTRVYDPLIDLAGRLANSPFVPDKMRGNPADTFSVLLAGHGLGLSPIQSLQSIVLISGRPYISTEVILGLAYRAGHQVQWLESTDKRATVRVTRGDGHGSAEVTYTMSQAQAAGLTGKDNWRKMPAEMLRARAVRAALKMAAPDIALGLEAADSPAVAAVDGPTGTTVVQVQTRPDSESPRPERLNDASEMQGELQNTVTVAVPAVLESDSVAAVSSPPVAVPPPDMITGPQRRKIGALIGQLERHDGHRMDRQERRDFIAALLELPDLESANDLTKAQAGDVIDRLEALLADAKPADDAEIVDAEVVE